MISEPRIILTAVRTAFLPTVLLASTARPKRRNGDADNFLRGRLG